MSRAQQKLVEVRQLTKRFPGVTALDNVDFDLLPGEVHVLFGENGAGKSTLISILAGVHEATSGEIIMGGEPVSLRSVGEARARGISAVFQEFSLVPAFTVAENIFLGDELCTGPLLDRAGMVARTRALFDSLGFDIDPRRQVIELSRAEQQMVEIAKAFHTELSILILDEPTASLTEKETRQLFAFIEAARAKGVGVIYISHRIHEFSQIGDRITVLRDGRLIGVVDARTTSEETLLEMMTGRSISEIYPSIARGSLKPVLQVQGLHAWGVHGVDLEVRAGEVLGVSGLVGSGKSRAWRSIMGLLPKAAGTVTLQGKDCTRATTRQMIRSGVFYLPPDRKSEGLQLTATSRENIDVNVLPGREVSGVLGLVSKGKLRAATDRIAERVGLPANFLPRVVSQLSGGNQQKVLFGKGFGQTAGLYILDEPTVGVDMGTRAALYRLIQELVEADKAVVVISSDLPEVLNLCHRMLVFAKGRISAELTGENITEENALRHFFAEHRHIA